jgi:hypothetical protein
VFLSKWRPSSVHNNVLVERQLIDWIEGISVQIHVPQGSQPVSQHCDTLFMNLVVRERQPTEILPRQFRQAGYIGIVDPLPVKAKRQ